MNKLEVNSWEVLDIIRDNAEKTYGQAGDLDSQDALAIFCRIADDYFELFYSDIATSYITHFDNEQEMRLVMKKRFKELGGELPEDIMKDTSFMPDEEDG